MQFSFIRSVYFCVPNRRLAHEADFEKFSPPHFGFAFSNKTFPRRVSLRKKKSGFSNKKGIFMFSFYSRNILAFTERKAAKKGREGVYIKHLFSVSFFSSRVIYLSLPSPPLFHLSPATASQARLFMLLLHFCVSLAPKALRINLSYRMFSRYMKKERRMKEINWMDSRWSIFRFSKQPPNFYVAASIKHSMECQTW